MIADDIISTTIIHYLPLNGKRLRDATFAIYRGVNFL